MGTMLKNSFYHFFVLLIVLLIAAGCQGFSDKKSDDLQPVCTPPPCAKNQVYACDEDCEGGCGTYCKRFTPAPRMLYTEVELVSISLTDDLLEITWDIPGITGNYYAVVAGEDHTCEVQEQGRLVCKGPLLLKDSPQTFRAYRVEDDAQAFVFDFTLP